MAWQTLSLHFRQTYDGGYRYLDKCGEFMLAASERLNLVPGEAKPTGAKMELPEQGVHVDCDSVFIALSVVYELPTPDGAFFINLCSGLAELVTEHFRPKGVAKNGFCIKSYWNISNVEDMLAATLGLGGDYHKELGKVLGLPPWHKRLDYTFSAGSKDLHLLLHPATFERFNLTKQTPGLLASKHEKSLVDRRNVFAERLVGIGPHALLLEVDLVENEPPTAVGLDRHFNELGQYNESLRKTFKTKDQ